MSNEEALRRVMADANLEFVRLELGAGQERQALSALSRDVVAEDRGRVEQAFRQAVAGAAAFDVEYRRCDGRSRPRWQHDVGVVLRDGAGQPETLAIVSADVTAVRDRELALVQARNEAVASNKAKSEFLAYMSHEIRTPLSAILGFSEILEDQGQSAEHLAESVRIIRKNGELLCQIVNNVLDLSKIEAGRLEVEQISFSARDVIYDVCSTFSAAARAKGVDLTCHFDESAPETIVGDPTRLKQVLNNIVGNAVKFTTTGQIRLAVRGVAEKRLGRKLEVLVSDTGIGFTVEQRARLFQTYSQGDGATARKYGGSGLGLVLSRRLARMLGGDVDLLESGPGQGSTFRILVSAEGDA